MPLAAAPGLDHLGGDHVNENLRKRTPFRVAFKVICRLIPAEVRIEEDRQKKVVSIVDDDQLAAGTFDR